MSYQIIQGDCIEKMKSLEEQSIHTVVTSPPYYKLRDYDMDKQIGNEETPQEYIENIISVFREVRRILRNDGTLWINIGDVYNKNKQLLGLPWRIAFALQDDGWYLRQDIIWNKPNVMPEPVKDRCTRNHEYIFLLSKSRQYYYDYESILEPVSQKSIERSKYTYNSNRPSTKNANRVDNGISVEQMGERFVNPNGRNKRSVWTVNTQSYTKAHFAVYPAKLIEPCILAGSPKKGIVFDPFTGTGTTGLVALTHGRNFIGIELNPEYIKLAHERLSELQQVLL